MALDLKVGDTVVRQDFQAKYGGQRYGGIATPVSLPHIFLFTDPASGKKFGYDRFEGPTEGGGYAYTGKGQVGDQTFTSGNKAILEAGSLGKTLLLFKAHSPYATYVGEFFLGDPEFWIQHAPDLEGTTRKVIVFNLVPFDGNPQLLETRLPKQAELQFEDWTPPSSDSIELLRPASSDEISQIEREEFDLQARFGNWLRQKGHKVRKLTIKTENGTLMPDLYDETMNQIFEAKKSPSREYVRSAIGQIIDYRYCAGKFGNLEASGAILLPSPPIKEQIEQCEELQIQIYYPSEDGFEIAQST